jgi:hypothetical protein
MAKRKKIKQVVTKDSLHVMLRNDNIQYVDAVIGRALLAILKRQTDDEARSADTKYQNGVGFNSADAKSGTLTAKAFAKNKSLLDWQRGKWLTPAKNGYPRLCKYAKQLNEIALVLT